MEWLDGIAGLLPAPREDEPPDLRRKIIAELRDHLQGAMQRELLFTGDAEQAKQNVLTRFGDPARIARKLWLDAMWEKIMTQRLIVIALALVAFVSVGTLGLTCFLVVQAGHVNQALFEQNRVTNELLMAKLAALEKAGGNSGKSMEWNSLKVKLSLEGASGTPIVGTTVTLFGNMFDTSTQATLDRTTNPDGIADFGLVRPGQYRILFETPWGESIDDPNSFLRGEIVTVLPGESQTIEYVCPSKPEDAEITMTVDWPSELAGQPLWLVCDLVQSPREFAGHRWVRYVDDDPKFVVVNPSGQLTSFDMRTTVGGQVRSNHSTFFPEGSMIFQGEEVRTYANYSRSDVGAPGIYRFQGLDSSSHPRDELFAGPPGPTRVWLPKTAPVSRFKWPAGTYSVAHFVVGRDSETQEKSLPDDMLHPVFLGSITVNLDETNPGTASLLYPDEKRAQSRRRSRQKAETEIPKFQAVAGQLNEWRLSIPMSLVELLTQPDPEREADVGTPTVP